MLARRFHKLDPFQPLQWEQPLEELKAELQAGEDIFGGFKHPGYFGRFGGRLSGDEEGFGVPACLPASLPAHLPD